VFIGSLTLFFLSSLSIVTKSRGVLEFNSNLEKLLKVLSCPNISGVPLMSLGIVYIDNNYVVLFLDNMV
jgi:hypothetical protein